MPLQKQGFEHESGIEESGRGSLELRINKGHAGGASPSPTEVGVCIAEWVCVRALSAEAKDT
jgi:hypothetical protein